MKILVTGAAGFIGSRIARALLAQGHEVSAIDSFNGYYDESIKRRNVEELIGKGLRLTDKSINEVSLPPLLDGVEAVFHQAGQPGVRPSWGASFEGYIDNNVAATQLLLEALKGSRTLKKFIYASSSSVYGDAETMPTPENVTPNPRSPYGVTKLAAEHLCNVYAKNFDIPSISLRYFTVYGPGQRPDMAFTRFCKAAVNGNTISVYGNGEQTRDFTYVDDVVKANLRALVADYTPGDVVNIAGGTHASVNDVLDILRSLTSRDLSVDYSDVALGDVRCTSGDTRRAQAVLGWKPAVDLKEGLAQQLSWADEVFS
ncbi:NAD-dependent epimerase/dehydratase family protein [Gordonia sp. HS-NH1]|uniref:NAD-dependent epimerase/dehydratase family protein n=1 Tax=Gordonia sp. HS-NH1 TaxID=1435068 RepID=UPI0012E0D2F6|nr:NAD-dependent epimerase/dehydratase family protein [Gordonia sp. HS-NH1]